MELGLDASGFHPPHPSPGRAKTGNLAVVPGEPAERQGVRDGGRTHPWYASAVLRSSLALLAMVVCFSGCGRFRMTRECRQYSQIVETGRQEIDRVTAPKTAAAYRSSAPLYARIAGQLRSAAGSSELRPSADDYARSVETVGRTVTAYAEALGSGDPARESSARKDLETATRRERTASRRLEDLCHGRIQVF
jgi:hypothetical protein